MTPFEHKALRHVLEMLEQKLEKELDERLKIEYGFTIWFLTNFLGAK